MNAPAKISRPEMAMPDKEAAALRAAFLRASVILEYGSGGSTVMAAEMPGKTIFSVESDRAWARMMRGWFMANPPVSSVEVVHADIGPTRDWGQPKTHNGWRRYAKYPLGVWETDRMPHPDVVFVDGRFRVGCALATAFHARKPVDLYFDDYKQRKHYHKAEEILGQPEMIGRMALFRVKPTPIPVDRLSWVVKMLTRP